jgi:hypothetical protein
VYSRGYCRHGTGKGTSGEELEADYLFHIFIFYLYQFVLSEDIIYPTTVIKIAVARRHEID